MAGTIGFQAAQIGEIASRLDILAERLGVDENGEPTLELQIRIVEGLLTFLLLAAEYATLQQNLVDAIHAYNEMVTEYNDIVSLMERIYDTLEEATLGGYISLQDWSTVADSSPPEYLQHIGEII